ATKSRAIRSLAGLPCSSTAPTRRKTPGPLANQPAVSKDGAIAIAPVRSTRPSVGRSPYTPLNDAGTRTDPPASLPNGKAPAGARGAAAEPLEEPPGIRPGARMLGGVP